VIKYLFKKIKIPRMGKLTLFFVKKVSSWSKISKRVHLEKVLFLKEGPQGVTF